MSPLTDPQTVRDAYLLPYRGRTLAQYVFYLDRFLNWCACEQLGMLDVARSDIERYVSHLVARHLQPASVLVALVPVRGLYRFAYEEGLIDRDPAVHVRRPMPPAYPRDSFGLDRVELRAFLATGEAMGGRYHATAYLLGCMALRAAEAASLQVGDYSQTVRGHRVLEFIGKGGKAARMPLPPPVIKALDAAAVDRRSGPILLRRNGSPYDSKSLYKAVATIGRRTGINHRVNPHALRRSAITNALESGASLGKVMDLARHSQPRTTMRYDRNRTNLDDHAVHTLVSFVTPRPLDRPTWRGEGPS